MRSPRLPTPAEIAAERKALESIHHPAPPLRHADRLVSPFRPHWVERTNRDRIYDVVLAHYREHGRSPPSIAVSRDLNIPYSSVRTAMAELRAEGRLLHRGKGVDVPAECVPEK